MIFLNYQIKLCKHLQLLVAQSFLKNFFCTWQIDFRFQMVTFNCTIAIHTGSKYQSSSKAQDTFNRIEAREKPRKIER